MWLLKAEAGHKDRAFEDHGDGAYLQARQKETASWGCVCGGGGVPSVTEMGASPQSEDSGRSASGAGAEGGWVTSPVTRRDSQEER